MKTLSKIQLGVVTLSLLAITLLPISSAEAKVTKKPIITQTALCRDGTYSYSANHHGTCSYHRGVKKWYK